MNEQQLKSKQNNSFLSQFIWWKLDPVQLEKQVDEYTSLKIYQSYRGIAILLIAGWIFLTKFFSLAHWIPNNKFVISLFIYEDIGFFSLLFYMFLIVFIYKGKKWAIIIAMFLQTLNSGFALISSISSGKIDVIFWLMIIFWWALFMKFLYSALKVEQLRNKEQKSVSNPLSVLGINKNKAFFILLGLFLSAGLFYWFEIRPSEIRSECSWVKNHTDAVPARLAKTEKELRDLGIIKDCPTKEELLKVEPVYYRLFLEKKEGLFPCQQKNENMIEDYKNTKPEIPAKDWLEKASESDYQFCLRSRGVTR